MENMSGESLSLGHQRWVILIDSAIQVIRCFYKYRLLLLVSRMRGRSPLTLWFLLLTEAVNISASRSLEIDMANFRQGRGYVSQLSSKVLIVFIFLEG